MSFALTTQQVLDRSKTVTRRLGWEFLKPGDLVQPVEKCQGLKPGESIKKLGAPIRIESVQRECLNVLLADPAYGSEEVFKEGFLMVPEGFVAMFCEHMRCQASRHVTRIEFSYVAAAEVTRA